MFFNKNTMLCFLELIIYGILTISSVVVASISNNVGIVAFIGILGLMSFVTLFKVANKKDITALLLYPVLLSAFQNVYLGYFAYSLSSTLLSLFVVLNFLYACILLAILTIYNVKIVLNNLFVRRIFIILFFIVFYGFVITIIQSSSEFLSIISSIRNTVSIFVFAIIGLLVYKKYNTEKLISCILLLGIIVIAIGFYERSTEGAFWRNLNITELWNKKGIRVQASGLPTAFYSSEKINGKRVLRMCSTFADPVNLGSFLVVVFILAKSKKRYILAVLALVSIVLTVSKGGILGVLIFLCVESYYKRNKIIFFGAMAASLIVGLAFLSYASNNDANSVFLHISGFNAAFSSLGENIFGDGFGSTGVLARQYGEVQNMEITESGLGMIIGQLGVFGLLLFVVYIVMLALRINKIGNKTIKTLSMGLLIFIFVNIMFNEVALSPNSCGIAFILIGYYLNDFNFCTKQENADKCVECSYAKVGE